MNPSEIKTITFYMYVRKSLRQLHDSSLTQVQKVA